MLKGEMEEYEIQIKRDTHSLWSQVCTLAINRHPDNNERALRFAKAQFRSITGRWPPYGAPLEPAGDCDVRLEALVRKNIESYIKTVKKQNYVKNHL